MKLERGSLGFFLAALGAMLGFVACDDWACGYGGPGCSDPIVGGLCENDRNTLVIGQEYILIFGYGSDTGVSEATVTSAVSADATILQAGPTPGSPDVPYDKIDTQPFDLNNGSGDGGVTLKPLASGKASVTISLKYWDKPRTMSFDVVDEANAPAGFIALTAQDRLTRCIGTTTTVP